MSEFQVGLGKRKPKGRRRTKGSIWMYVLGSSPQDRSLIQEALGQTFYCERFNCRLLPENCIQRQKSWDPEIYESCTRCNQGLEVVKRIKRKNKDKKAA